MKLLCIDDSRGKGSEHIPNFVSIGETYTMRRIEGSLSNEKRVLLKELKNPPVYITELQTKCEPGFRLSRFVEIEDTVEKEEEEEEESKEQIFSAEV